MELVESPRQIAQPLLEHLHVGRRRTLLRAEDRRRIEEGRGHVAGDLDVDPVQRPAERIERSEPAVGRRRAAHADDHPAAAVGDRGGDELAGAVRRRRQGVVVHHEREAAGAGHLDDGGAVGERRPLRRD